MTNECPADIARQMRALRPRIPESGTCPACGAEWAGERLEGEQPRVYCGNKCRWRVAQRARRARQQKPEA